MDIHAHISPDCSTHSFSARRATLCLQCNRLIEWSELCVVPVREHMAGPKLKLSVSRQLLRSHYKLPGTTQNRHILAKNNLWGQTTHSSWGTYFFFTGVWINFSSLFSKTQQGSMVSLIYSRENCHVHLAATHRHAAAMFVALVWWHR